MNRDHNISSIGEYFHCYNRGTEKRDIFLESADYSYFLRSLKAYNSVHSTGKLRLSETNQDDPLVAIVAYCLLPNHYHIVMRNEVEGGISKYLQKVSTGYTMYFNQKNNRSGSLFQGKYKSKPIDADQDLQQVTAYVYKNFKIHAISDKSLYRSSLNTHLDVVRGWTSNLSELDQDFDEVVEIIKLSRLSLE